MSKELKITTEKVLEASKQCEQAKEVLEAMFPEAFEEEWVDITVDIEWEVEKDGSEGGFLRGFYGEEHLLTASNQRFGISPMSKNAGTGRFKVKHSADRHTILKRK